MRAFLTAIGWVGLAGLCLALVLFCVLTFRIHRVVDGTLERATLAVQAVEEKATDMVSAIDVVEAVAAKLDEREEESIADDPSRVAAACDRLISALEKLDSLLYSVRSKLESAVALVEMARSLGLRIEVSRVDEVNETLDALAQRLDRAKTDLTDVSERLPQGSLKDAAGRAAVSRVLAAADSVLSPAAALTGQVERLSDALGGTIEQRQADARFFANSAVGFAVVLAAWMGLGQVALIRGGLLRDTP